MTTRLATAPDRSKRRRSEDELIAELQAKIEAVESRIKQREVTSSQLNKDFERFKKHASKFVQACVDQERSDVANTILGVLNVAERQIKNP